MAANARITGTGLFYVTSNISRPDLLDYDNYIKWYDEDHIAEIIGTSGFDSAYRYIDTDPHALKPYLAFYPMRDIGFTQSEEFRKIRVKSDLLPGTGIIYDLADVDVRYLGLLGKSGERKGVAEYLLSTAIEPGAEASDIDAERWLDDAQGVVSKLPGYQRTTKYRLLYARTNAQSRALKGLPTTDEVAPEPPKWQAIHEFVSELDPFAVIEAVRNASNLKAMLENAKQVELSVYKLAKAHGNKAFFD